MSAARVTCVILALVAVATGDQASSSKAPAQPTSVDGAYFLETFTDPIEGKWVKSTNKMYSGNGDIKQQAAQGEQGIPGDAGLVLSEESRRYGIAAPFEKSTVPGKELVIQYELKLAQSLECAGAYLKVLSGSPDLKTMNESTSYTVMFGPDKCGTTNKVHLILRFQNEKTGDWKEHHLKTPPLMKNDKEPHLYTAVLRPDNTFEIFIDQKSEKSGSLTSDSDWDIPFTPAKEIDDPKDKKPSDWVDAEKIADPAAKKPADWDEDAPKTIVDAEAKKPADWDESAKEKIPDPDAKKPDDWDEDEDGAWEAPLISNPKCKTGCGPWKAPMKANPAYKGKWSAPMIANPKYKGVWKAKRIENPAYYVVTDPVAKLAPMGAVAVEVWVHKPHGIMFDNILVNDDFSKASDFGAATWKVRADAEKKAIKAAADKAKAETRKKKLATGGFMTQVEEYTKMGAEIFAQNPWFSFPLMLLFFFLIFKFCRGEKKERPRRAAPREANPKEAEDDDTTSKASKADDDDDAASSVSNAESAAESVAENKNLRQRKGKEKKGKDEDEEEDDKDK